MPAKTLMVVGASSSAGKSLLVTALCRIYARRGVRVAPFKAQNMSNNAAVCPDGAEIGRAQAVQAAAAGILPTADMNPVLLKPEADSRSQVILLGRPLGTDTARAYYTRQETLWAEVTAALDRLRAAYELVIVEGAGSPVELNLKPRDIVNMPVAAFANAPVLLVGDIDRGGIFAQLLGTLWLLDPPERALVRGLVVNKFRGDLALFADGIRILEERSGVPVLGTIPYLHDLGIAEEDAVALDVPSARAPAAAGVDIAVIRLPHIANFDDFDPLAAEPGVRVRYASTPGELGHPRAVILPGTKSTTADVAWLRSQGLAQSICDLAQTGCAVVGICGGYQMLGRSIRDPERIEADLDSVAGLGLLPVETVFHGEKVTVQTRARVAGGPGWISAVTGQALSGYEIHVGRTESSAPWLEITAQNGQPAHRPDGAFTPDGRVWGCYLHGLFANPALRRAWLASLGWEGAEAPPAALADPFDRLADVVEAALDMPLLDTIIRDQAG